MIGVFVGGFGVNARNLFAFQDRLESAYMSASQTDVEQIKDLIFVSTFVMCVLAFCGGISIVSAIELHHKLSRMKRSAPQVSNLRKMRDQSRQYFKVNSKA